MSDTTNRALDLSAEKKELLRRLKKQGGLARSEKVPPIQPIIRQEGDLFPLSFAQQRLWILDQLDPGTPLYTIPLALRLMGKVHIPALTQAIAEIVRRHEALRTAFVEVDGIPYQKILPAGAFLAPLIDLRQLKLNERRKKALDIVAEEEQQPFDLTSGILLRAQLLQLDEDEYILNLCMHHIASDAWSIEIFFKETMLLYKAFAEGRPSPLPNLPVQYIDYAVWQRQWLQGERLERQILYWKEQLSGVPSLLPLPTDHPRPALQTFRGSTTTFHLSPELTRALKTFSQREGVTLFMTVLSAFKVWLYRHTRQKDIVVGTPMANRQYAGLEHLIGFFINTLVLRTKISGNANFCELLQCVRKGILDAFGRCEVPFEMVVNALQVERNLSSTPLFQVLFTLQTEVQASAQQTDFLVKPLDGKNTVAKFDLLLAMAEEVKEGRLILTGNFEYNCDLFESSTIDRFIERFITLLEAIVTQPEQSLDALPWFSAAERELVLHTWNATRGADPDDLCIYQCFEAQARRTPWQLALVAEDKKLNYEQLDRQANQVAHALRRYGVAPGVIVGLCLPRTADLVIALLGIFKCGGAYLPLDPGYPPERLVFQLQDAQAHLLITNSNLEALWESVDVVRFFLDKEQASLVQEVDTPLEVEGQHRDHLAYIIYTSGSTGRPKGVSITQRNARTLISWGTGHFSKQELSGVLAGTSICFDLSIFELFVPLSAGGTVYLVENSLQLPTGPEREHITLINTVPAVMRELLRSRAIPASVSVVNLAGERLSRSLVQELYQIPTIKRVYNLYGPTEDTTYSTWELMDNQEKGEPSIGRSLDQRRAYVLDEQGDPVPIGIPGEIYLGGDGLTRGYQGRADLTAERYVPDPFSTHPGERLYRTGDLARWLSDGRLAYLGRNDHQVKIRGFRIELGEIEQHLALCPLIYECAVQVQQDQLHESQYLAAYVVPKGSASPSVKELRTYLQQHLPDYMLPSLFVFLEALPRTANGKIDHQALVSPAISSRHPREMLQPRDPLEETVAAIWRQLLGREEIGPRENFFELGGHSLLGMQLISRLRVALQVELPLRRLFETPTVEGLAQAIAQVCQEEQSLLKPPITPRPSDFSGPIPISFAQQRLWILDKLEPGSPTYYMPYALRLSGPLHRAALERSLSEVVARHAILRTSFPMLDDMPVQLISPTLDLLPLPFTDLKHLSPDERERELLRLIEEEKRQQFDLASGPLFRTHLIAVAEEEHVLCLNMHHIVSDGWSMRVMAREVSLLYPAFAAGKASPLAPLSLQYADYAIWQRTWFQGEVLERQLSYWITQLAGAPDLLLLPTDRPRGAMQSFRGASYTFTISPEIATGLKALGQRTGTTLFMTLLAAFQVLLNRYSHQDDIVVGTPIANRTHAEVEGIIGFFVNTLALRTNFSGDPSFLDVLQRVRQTVLDAFTYQDLPFEQVVEAVQPERNLARSPLIQVMFTLQIDPAQAQNEERIDLAPLTVSALPIAQETAKFDLTFTLSRSIRGFDAEFEYNTDLFDRATIAHMSEHFKILLAGILQDPALPIARLPLLTSAEYPPIMYDQHFLRERVPDYMVPATFAPLAELPQTSHGQVDRQALVARHLITRSASEKYVAPRDALELQLAQLWEKLLGTSPIGVTDNFFQLGGHSLAGVRLMSQIQRLFYVDLPLSTLFKGATIASLAAILRQHDGQVTPHSLVELQAKGSRPPLFCVHAVGGEVLCYMHLARHLGAEQPVYGLQPFEIHACQKTTPSIEEMATHYIEALRAVQPEGPYQLCGWSMGGVIAFEMAQQLEVQGQRVMFLGLIDSYLPSIHPDQSEHELLLQFLNNLIEGADTFIATKYSEIRGIPLESQLEYLLSEIQHANILLHGIDTAYLTRLFSTFKKNWEAISRYQVRPYTNKVTLFQASASSRSEKIEISHGWCQFISQIHAIHTLPGNHYTILHEPHVEVLAQQILYCLDEVSQC